MILKNYGGYFQLSFFFFFNPSSYTFLLNGPFHQIRSFSVAHLWHSPERLVLLFINDNKGKRENSKHRSLNNSRNILGGNWPVHGIHELFVWILNIWILALWIGFLKITPTPVLSDTSVTPLQQTGRAVRHRSAIVIGVLCVYAWKFNSCNRGQSLQCKSSYNVRSVSLFIDLLAKGRLVWWFCCVLAYRGACGKRYWNIVGWIKGEGRWVRDED